MTASPARVVAQLLADAGVSPQVGRGSSAADAVPNWTVFVADEPDAPDDCLTVYDTTPAQSARLMEVGDGGLGDHAGVQVRVRSRSHPAGWDKAKAVLTALSTVFNATAAVGGDTYSVQCLTGLPDEPTALGRDRPTSARRLFTINCFVVTVP